MTAVVVALAVAVVVLAVLVAGLLRSHAEILKALHELGAGLELDRGEASVARGPQPLVLQPLRAAAPVESGADRPTSISGTTLDDEAVALSLQGESDTLLAFLSSGCTTCQTFWRAFAEGDADVPGGARLVVVPQSAADESLSALRSRAPRGVPLVLSSEAWAEFGVPGSPYFVYVEGATGRVVGEGSAASWPQVVDLLQQARADAASRTAGTPGGGAHRAQRDEQALAAAGISAGHPSLWTPAGDRP